jgi:hypothetical protein
MPQLALPPQGRKGNRKPAGSSGGAKAQPRALAQALEPRVMLDAAALGTMFEFAALDPVSDDLSSLQAEQLISPEGPSPAGEIVFIDAGILDWQLLLLDLPANVEVVMLDPARDGLEQMADHLAGRSNLAAIHIITHGSEATAFIGGARLDLGNVDAYAAYLGVIGAALSETGDILFYGCDIAAGEDGAALIARIAALTGADVAASTNLTGAQQLGGDWVLESATGEIEAQLVVGWEAQAAFSAVLAFDAVPAVDGHPLTGIPVTATTGFGTYFADITGNGFADIIVRNATDDGIAFWQNEGNGTWTPQAGTDNPFCNIVVSNSDFGFGDTVFLDIDGDGDIDAYNILRNEFWRNDGGLFTAITGGSNPLNGFAASVAGTASFVSGDFTGNGFTDLAGRSPDNNSVVFWQNNGNGTWTQLEGGANPFNGISVGGDVDNFFATQLVVADIDGDGWLDIYNWTLNQFWRNNNGTFEVAGANPLNDFRATAANVDAFITGDFTGNGYTDIVARNTAEDALVFARNNGDGTWTQLTGGANPFNGISFANSWEFDPFYLAVIDANGDGDLDIYNRETNVLFQNDITAPALVSSAPAFGGNDVAPSATLVLNFSQAVNLSDGSAGTTNAVGYGDIAIYDAATNTLIERINVVANAGRISGMGTTTITIDPVGNLPAGANVYVLIGSKAFVTGGGVHFLGIDQADVFTFAVSANAAPVLAGASGTTAAFEQVPIAIVPGITVSDADNATLASATVSITGNFQIGQDVIGFTNAAGMGNIDGSYNATTGVLTLTSAGATATLAQWQAAMRAVTYNNTSDTPNVADRTVSITVNDGTSNSSAATQTLTVTAVNDAPTITNGANFALTGTNENTTSGTTLVSAILIGVGFADVDGPSSGIAVTGFTGNGTWQYDAAGTWVNFGAVTNANAMLLSGTTSVRYVPDGQNGETPSITFRAWDGSSGTASTNAGPLFADTSTNGGSTGFSTGVATASMTVTDVNDAPVLVDAVQTLTAIIEDLPAPTNDSLANATQLATLLGTVTDVDSGSLRGAAITAVSPSGTLWYSLDEGATWTAAPLVGEGSALLLRDTDYIYFQPAANVNGTIAAAIAYRAWDQTSGTVGTTADTTTNGGTTAFSTFVDTASVAITPVNDAPVITAGGVLASVPEDTANPPGAALNTLVSANDDIDGGTIPGFAIISNPTSAALGEWQYSTNGTTWFAIGTVNDGATALGLTATTLVRFLPAENYNGTPSSLLVRAVDESHAGGFTAGATRVTIDTTLRGGTTAISLNSAGITTTITAVNDLPVFSNLNGGGTFVEGGAAIAIDTDVSIADVELDALNDGAGDYSGASLTILRQGVAVAQDVFSVATGSSLSVVGSNVTSDGWVIATLNNGTPGQIVVSFANNGIIPTTALVNEVMRAITYANSSDDPPASVTLDWTFSDGNAGNAQGTGANPGIVVGSAVITITPVNDAPTLTATGANPNYVEGAAAATLFTGVTVSTVEAGQTITELTLTVTNVSNGAAEILRIGGIDVALTNDNSVAVSGGTAGVSVTDSTATVTLTGTSLTSAQAQTLVEGLGYRNASDNPATAANRVVTLTSLTDSGGTAGGGADTTALAIASTVTLTAVNDAPVIAGLAGDTVQTVAGGSPAFIDLSQNAVVSDVDSPYFAGGSLTIAQTDGTANGSFSLGGTVSTSGGDGTIAAGQNIVVDGVVIGTVDAVLDGQGGNNLTITLNADATPERVTLLVRDILYGAGSIGSRTFAMTISDGADASAAANFTVEVTPNPPVITGLGGDAVTYQEGAAPTLLDLGGNATVTDPDSANFDGGELRVAITAGAVPTQDVLSVVAGGAVTLAGATVSVGGVAIGTLSGGTNGNDLVVTLNSDATLARTGELLRAIAYANSNNDDPTAGVRTVTVTIRDAAAGPGSAISAPVTVSVTVEAVNDAPTLTVPGAIAGTEDQALAITGISMADVDAGNAVVTLSFSVAPGNGVIAAASGAGVTVTGSATNALTLSGTIASINAFVAASNVVFSPALNLNGAITLTVLANDGGASGSGGALTATETVTLNMAAVNDAPVITVPAAVGVTEDVASPITGITFADVDAGGASVVVTFSVPSGTLAASAAGGVAVAGSGTGVLTLTGSIAAINAFVAGSGVTFTTLANATADVTLTVTIDDQGNTGSGGALTDTRLVTLAVTAVNDAPVLSLPATVQVVEDIPSPVTGITVSDVDAGANQIQLRFLSPSGTMSAASGLGVTVAGSGSAALALTGTLADLNAFIAAERIFFTTAPDATAPVVLTVEANDLGNTGTGGAQIVSSSLTILVTPVNDAPRLANPIAGQAALVGAPFAFAIPGNTFFDPDVGDVITLSATRDDGSPLPSWLSFNPATASFSGTPPADFAATATELRMMVRATDLDGEFVTTTFVLTVTPDDSTGDVGFRLLDTSSATSEREESRPALVEDKDPILTGDALRLLFENTGSGTNIAQVFQGKNDLSQGSGFVPDDQDADASESDEPMLIFRDGNWFIIDPAADGGMRLFTPAAQSDETGPDNPNTEDPDQDGGGEEGPAGAQAFSRQLIETADAFDRRAAALDLALFSHGQNV